MRSSVLDRMSTSFRFNPFDDHHLVRELIERNLVPTLISSQKDPELSMVPSYKHKQLEAPHHHIEANPCMLMPLFTFLLIRIQVNP